MRYDSPVSRPGAAIASMTQPYCFHAVSAARHLPVMAHTNRGTTADNDSMDSVSSSQGGMNA